MIALIGICQGFWQSKWQSKIRKYQIKINNKTITAGTYGEWIPMSTSGLPGEASKTNSFTLGKIKMVNAGSNWYGGIVLDDISAAPWSKVEFTGESIAPEKAMTMWVQNAGVRAGEMSKANSDRNMVSRYLEAMEGKGNSAFGTNRPFGKLNFTFASTGKPIENYRRSLDIHAA